MEWLLALLIIPLVILHISIKEDEDFIEKIRHEDLLRAISKRR